MARGRKPIGDKAMTPAQRQQRRRDKYRAALPPRGSEERFRLELYWWVMDQALFYGKLDVWDVAQALDELGTALKMDVWSIVEDRDPAWLDDYLTRSRLFDPKYHAPKKPIGAGIDTVISRGQTTGDAA
jgi:hypothetical protein